MQIPEEASFVRRLRTLSVSATVANEVEERVKADVVDLILPDAAKILAALATDALAAVQRRNDRRDVNDAYAALRVAVALLEVIDSDLDG